MVKVLFVCLGNICRSPAAEGVFRALAESQSWGEAITVDSAATGAYHVGEPPDERMQAAARRRGVEIGHQRARQIGPDDFAYFDHILAMDRDNQTKLAARCPAAHRHKIRLFLDHAPQRPEREVPDPYYGGPRGFDNVLDMIEDASRGLLASLRRP